VTNGGVGWKNRLIWRSGAQRVERFLQHVRPMGSD
jgi:hypothetical protein